MYKSILLFFTHTILFYHTFVDLLQPSASLYFIFIHGLANASSTVNLSVGDTSNN